MFTDAVVEAVTDITPDCKQFTLRLTEGVFDGEEGQHTVIRRPNGDARPYSVLTVDGDRAVFMIRAYDVDGVADYMHRQEVGDTVEVNPTLSGNLTLRSAERPAVFVGTGTGITPLVGMLHQYLERGGDDAVFLFGEKTQEQLMYKPMFEQLELMHPLQTQFSLSRETWSGHEGYVQELLDDVVDTYGAAADYYICGVPPAVVDGKERLRELGVPDERIHSEGWEEGEVARQEE